MSLCKYRNAFGEPGKGVHFHVLGIAIFDLAGTFIISFILHKIFHWNLWVVFLSAMILAIILHRLFCVNTTINKLIFGNV